MREDIKLVSIFIFKLMLLGIKFQYLIQLPCTKAIIEKRWAGKQDWNKTWNKHIYRCFYKLYIGLTCYFQISMFVAGIATVHPDYMTCSRPTSYRTPGPSNLCENHFGLNGVGSSILKSAPSNEQNAVCRLAAPFFWFSQIILIKIEKMNIEKETFS